MSDPEKIVRENLISFLSPSFSCYEEVKLRTISGQGVRCDVLARPMHPDFEDYLFAFECKRPSKDWHYAKWARALKQTADYIDAAITDDREFLVYPDERVTASFIFPAPFSVPTAGQVAKSPLVRDGFENAIAGMFHLALMFRVGRCGLMRDGEEDSFSIGIGPHLIWNRSSGFPPKAHELLACGRPVGSSNRK